jgi:rubredoxin
VTDAAHLTQQPNGEPVIHARRGPDYRAICGAPPGSPWTHLRRNVTCRACVAEIERRVAARAAGIPI